MDGSFSLSERERFVHPVSSIRIRRVSASFVRIQERDRERKRERERERETRGVREFSGGGKMFRRYTRGVGIRVHDKKKRICLQRHLCYIINISGLRDEHRSNRIS